MSKGFVLRGVNWISWILVTWHDLLNILACCLDRKIEFMCVSFLEKLGFWSLDQGLILVIIVLYCCLWLIMLNQVVLYVHKQFLSKSPSSFNLQIFLQWFQNHLIGTSDTPSELPTSIGNSWLLPTEPSRPFSLISLELLTYRRKFRPPTKVPHNFCPGVLGKTVLSRVGTSDVPSELPTRLDPIYTPWTVTQTLTHLSQKPPLPVPFLSQTLVVIWHLDCDISLVVCGLDSLSVRDSNPLHLSSDPRGKSSR